ncbi:MAG: S8 family serine peptidase [Planctomycetota bacterium]|jgi:hypothetical protein
MAHIFKNILVAIAVCFIATASVLADTQLQPEGLDYAKIDSLKELDPNLTGLGVKYALICRSINYLDGKPQNDYTPDMRHRCLASKTFNFFNQPDSQPGVSPHSTAICSILFGQDPNASDPQLGDFYYRGITPQADADIYEFWHFLTNNVFDLNSPAADIITTSIGFQFQDWWTRGFESLAEHYGTTVVASIGNGTDVYDPPLYPGSSANVIGVGVIDSVDSDDAATRLSNFAIAYPQHSSFGPTGDGRVKPDIVAPGNCLAAVTDTTGNYEPTQSWSSFATPIVAGTIGLLKQKAKQDPNLSPLISTDGGNCLTKAIVMNSATKLPYWHKGQLTKEDDHDIPLDFIQGAGAINALGAYKNLVAGQATPGNVEKTGWDLNDLDTNQIENLYRITTTTSADEVITATLIWNRHYSDSYPFESIPEKDNNLRLELWAIDINNPDRNYLLDYSDSNADNIEHIYTKADPNYTTYEIVVSYSPSNSISKERYGLAWNLSQADYSDNILWYDLNADGIVNDADSIILIANWLKTLQPQPGYLLGDINEDGSIEKSDIQILMDHMGRKAPWNNK